jgi:hypothetical protein
MTDVLLALENPQNAIGLQVPHLHDLGKSPLMDVTESRTFVQLAPAK